MQGDEQGGAYQCVLTLSDPAGWTIMAGGPARAFVAPAARDYAGPGAGVAVGIGGAMEAVPIVATVNAHAVAWGAARARAIRAERKEKMYQDYVTEKRRLKVLEKDIRDEPGWWGVEGKKGGARLTVEGCLGEEQADKLFRAQGHRKLNHGGDLVDALDPPRGRGLDGVWENAAPPPTYLITETKFTLTPDKPAKLSSGGQMSDKWVRTDRRLQKALGDVKGEKMRESMRNNDIGKRLLHVDSDGHLNEYDISAAGKFDLKKTVKETTGMTKREPLLSEEYFDRHIMLVEGFLQKVLTKMATYPNQAAAKFDVIQYCASLLYSRYSRGFLVAPLKNDLMQVLEAWEALPTADVEGLYLNSFKNAMGDYVTSLGLLSLAALLHYEQSVIARLVVCIGNEGKDLLYERLVARLLGYPKRKLATKLLYPKAYQVLYDALDAPAGEQPLLLQQFLQNWYQHLGRVGWHDAHKGPEGGGFDGYWCWEAAGVAYASGIDDATFRDLRYYPKDLADYAKAEKQPA